MRRAAAPLLAVLLAGATGCSSGSPATAKASDAPTLKQPPVTAFAAGPCRSMAPDLLGIERDALQLGTTPTPPEPVRLRLKQEQDRIRALQPSFKADKVFAPVVQELVVAVGVARLASDTNEYKASYAADISRTDAAVIAACTSGAATPSP